MDSTKLCCKVDGIVVKPVQAAEKLVGKGTPAPYMHVSQKDPDGNPFCGKVALTENDVESFYNSSFSPEA